MFIATVMGTNAKAWTNISCFVQLSAFLFLQDLLHSWNCVQDLLLLSKIISYIVYHFQVLIHARTFTNNYLF
uniref:Uncharacterized protein n=1 Tax=Arundo donax TaxID=35708 RepID=A0A0A9T310_ARUDO